MREFMTRVSDYFNERRNNPERQENTLAVILIGVAAVIVIVLLLLLLWRHVLNDKQKDQESMMDKKTHEETMEQYMAEPSADTEALRQEYLTSVEYLGDKVEELLQALTEIQEELSETITLYQEGDKALSVQITEAHKEITRLVQELKKTQVELTDLADVVQVINKETLPVIQQQLVGIQNDIAQINTDISEIYTKIAALETEDEKLWASLKTLEKSLGDLMSNELAEITKRIENLSTELTAEQERFHKLASCVVMYRYDAASNTLYLLPYEE